MFVGANEGCFYLLLSMGFEAKTFSDMLMICDGKGPVAYCPVLWVDQTVKLPGIPPKFYLSRPVSCQPLFTSPAADLVDNAASSVLNVASARTLP